METSGSLSNAMHVMLNRFQELSFRSPNLEFLSL